MREPYNIGVMPYRMSGPRRMYAVFCRRDLGLWQCITGGGIDGERPDEAARREMRGKAGIESDELVTLDTRAYLRADQIDDGGLWAEDQYVVPQVYFGVRVNHGTLAISEVHREYRWCSYRDAHSLLHYDADRTALWELEQRISGRGPRG